MIAETKAQNARCSGLIGELIVCLNHHRQFLALFVTGPWLPEYGPSRWPIHIEVLNGEQLVLTAAPSIEVLTPCGCPAGQRMAPHVTVEFFPMEGED